MSIVDWVSLVACAGHLAVAALVIARRARSPLSLPLTLMTLDLFTWNFAALAHHYTKQPAWHWLDVAMSPLTPPLGYHVIGVFVGRARDLRGPIAGGYVAFGALSLSNLVPGLRPYWAMAFVVMVLPASLAWVWVLVRHLRGTADPTERTRTRLLLGSIGSLSTMGVLDLLTPVDTVLSPLGTIVSTSLMAVMVLRLRLFGRALSIGAAVYALLFGALGVVAYFVVFRYFAANTGALVLGTLSVTLFMVATVRELAATYAAARERMARLAFMGRFSSQLAHDLKNPLAALKGALQFLREEHAQGRPLGDHADFLDLMLEQVTRLGRVVDDYQRLARVEPVRSASDLNDLVRRVVALQPFATHARVTIETSLDPAVPRLRLDADLVATALENLVRNAFEAMPDGGVVRVTTAREPAGSVDLSVRDTGGGMDARQQEHAFDEFFSTKPAGSGLGLAFVRRVAHAHGGDVTIESQIGRGTAVTLHIPDEP